MEETVFEIPRRRSRRHRRRHGQGPRRIIIGVLAACLLGGGFWWLTREQPLPGQNISLPDYVEQDLLPVNQWSRPGNVYKRQPERRAPTPPATLLWVWRER